MIVVDTSVLVDFFRGRETPATTAFERLERDQVPFALTGVTVQELLQGARGGKEWELLLSYLVHQRVLAPSDPLSTHIGAARISYDCRRRGLTIRGPIDCWIAQIVLEDDGILLHDDRDFEKIREVRPLRTFAGLGGSPGTANGRS